MISSLPRLAIGWSSLLLAPAMLSAAPPDELAPLLDAASRGVAALAENLPAMTCTETVTQLKLGEGAKVLARRQSLYDYLILVDAAAGDFGVNESRVEKGKPPKEPREPLLATSGFATLLLVLHPHFRPSFRYRLLQPDPDGARPQQVIAFEHVSGTPSPTLLEVNKREYPISWRGTVWVDPVSGMITRIRTELRQPLEDIGLVSLQAEARYEPVPFAAGRDPLWLPKSASVVLRTRHQHWRNTHEFTGYHRFEVTTETRSEKPASP